MLCSMTGFGEARSNGDAISVHAEVRSVNNRHLKVNSRLQDGYGSLEPRCDALVRNKIRRGTIQLTLYVDHEISPDDLKINQTVLLSYHHQISEAASKVAMASGIYIIGRYVLSVKKEQYVPLATASKKISTA